MMLNRFLVGGRFLARGFGNHSGQSQLKPSLIQRIRNSWIPIPTGVGITLLAILQWRRLERERNKDFRVAKNWEITCYKAIPLRSLSRMFGWVSETPIPERLRPLVYSIYARTFGVNMEEIAEPVDTYNCMGSFFTRKLKHGIRPIDKHSLVSPADGMVLNAGRLTSFQVEQVKGVTYSLHAFLGDVTWKKLHSMGNSVNNFSIKYSKNDKGKINSISWNEYKNRLLHNPKNELYQCVVYLAPGDYHRFHSPVTWNVNFRRHFQGELLSVNPKIAKWIPGLFELNERAVYVGTWQHGFFSMTAVGATNVGSIRVYDDKLLHTNTRKWKDYRHKDRRVELNWRKGEEVGEFRMGSTLVLIFEAPPDFRMQVTPGSKVKVGCGLTHRLNREKQIGS